MKVKKIPVFLSLLILFQCAANRNTPETLESIYERGQYYISTGDFEKAKQEFLKIQSINPQFAPAYEGLGLVYFNERNLRFAEAFYKRAIETDDTWYPAYSGLAKVLYEKRDYENSLEYLVRARESGIDNFELYFYLGLVYKRLKEYSKAKENFEKALKINPDNIEVKNELDLVSGRVRELPGYPSILPPLNTMRFVNRAQFTVLLDYILGSEEFYSLFHGKEPETDFQLIGDKHKWKEYNSYIERILKFGLLNLYPDRTFRPEEKINKTLIAVLVQKIIFEKTKDRLIETKFLDSDSPFSDISNNHYAFNAVMTAVTRGLLKGKIDGSFGISDYLSGDEILDILSRLKKDLLL